LYRQDIFCDEMEPTEQGITDWSKDC